MLTVAGTTCSISLTDAFTILPHQGKVDQSYALVSLKATPHNDKSLQYNCYFFAKCCDFGAYFLEVKSATSLMSIDLVIYFSIKIKSFSVATAKKGEEYFVAIGLASILLLKTRRKE